MDNDKQVSSYLAHLPAVFHTEPFIGRFLLAFEAVLSGLPKAARPGLEETIDGLHAYFDPEKTDEEFLPWLASWVALSLRADWDTATKRAFIRQVVALYKLRGTKAGLQKMLEIYTGEKSVQIFDDFERPAHFFQVLLTLTEADPLRMQQKQRIARAIIDQEKPAHTFYALQIAVPTMRLVSLALQKKEGGTPPLLILNGEKTKGNTILGTTMGGG
jgi:phage tail-like protein